MRLVLSISEKAARRLRILAAEQGHRGVSALIESVYGGDALLLANLVAKLAAQGPGTMTSNDIDWTKFDADRGGPPFVTRTRELTDAQIDDLIKQGPCPIVPATDCGFGPGPFLIDSERAEELHEAKRFWVDAQKVHPAATEVAPEILPEIVEEEGTLGEGHE